MHDKRERIVWRVFHRSCRDLSLSSHSPSEIREKEMSQV